MGFRRRPPTSSAGEPFKSHHRPGSPLRASDVLPLPLYLTNALFLTLFFSVAYFLLHRWRDKITTSTPLHVVSFSEIAAIVSMIASVIYLLGFFGIGLVQSAASRSSPNTWDDVDDTATVDRFIIRDDTKPVPCPASKAVSPPSPTQLIAAPLPGDDEEIVQLVVSGSIPSHSLESKLGDCKRAAAIRREALERVVGRSLEGLPLDGFDYESILGQCCEMPVGYVQIPVGMAGPLLLDGKEYTVPMATTEGCLVASTNRGCKAIAISGGANSVVLKDGMTRAPVVRFGSAKRAAELKFFMEDPNNYDTISVVFNR